ncbi:hypothetical protein [Microbacterium sp. cx-59]|uniref:hypothetical protein n=1 Tax=Microbacterium sp. cx-59 TaxID=2891207 RepID=UPI001E5575C5|nr:hypothetical protein [Microbacterium sp. cx-59]MCC4907522.1 hypothetical protein [Microbacterium sp. cx-59]
MAGRRTPWRLVGIIAVLGAVAAIVYAGLIGGQTAVPAGAQANVCGVQVGILEASDTAALVWGDDGRATLAAGERVRIAPWCVIEVRSVDGESDDTESDGAEDGAGPTVNVGWRLW